jgi:hypothetical protein
MMPLQYNTHVTQDHINENCRVSLFSTGLLGFLKEVASFQTWIDMYTRFPESAEKSYPLKDSSATKFTNGLGWHTCEWSLLHLERTWLNSTPTSKMIMVQPQQCIVFNPSSTHIYWLRTHLLWVRGESTNMKNENEAISFILFRLCSPLHYCLL